MATKRKNVVYVGGLTNQVTEELLHAAFIPFGDIRSVELAKDFAGGKLKGFGFVEYELEEDADAAIQNMDGAEFFGKVLHCNVAKPVISREKGKPIWSSEEWVQNRLAEESVEDVVDETPI